jgi:hypothetical protein
VPDHQHQVRAQHGEVIGDCLGVRRPDPYVHHDHAGSPGKRVVPGGHLAAIRIRAGATRQRRAELLHVPGVVGEQHVPLERLGRRPGVVLQAVDRQSHSLRPKQEQLLAPQVPAGLVNRRPEPWITQVKRFAPRADRDPGAGRCQPAQLSFQVPADRPRRSELPPAPGYGPTRAAPRSAADSGQPGQPPPWRRTAAAPPLRGRWQAWPRSPPTRSLGHHDRGPPHPGGPSSEGAVVGQAGGQRGHRE